MRNAADLIPLAWPNATSPLNFLKDSPVNCLVVKGAPEIKPGGLDIFDPANLPTSIIAVDKAKWPRVPSAWRGKSGNKEERAAAKLATGPTGTPWVDSNGWISSLEHARSPDKTIWISVAPPNDSGMVRGDVYALAVADAAAYGSRWTVSLDDEMRAGLIAGNAEAAASWKKISDALEFFERHKAWRAYQPVANLGVLSDFQGPNEYIGGEVLNLCNRRHLAFRVIDEARADEAAFHGLKAVLLVQQKVPNSRIQQLTGEFLAGGGLVIAPASLAHMTTGMQAAGNYDNSYDYFSHGDGRLAVARKPWTDPYQLATDTHLLLSRRYDVLRLWNAGLTNAYYTRSSDGQGLVQIVNYAARSFGHPMSLYVAHPYKSARMTVLSSGTPENLTITPKGEGVEVNLPPFPVYAAIEFGGAS